MPQRTMKKKGRWASKAVHRGREPRTPQIVEAVYCCLRTRAVVTVLAGVRDAPPVSRPFMGRVRAESGSE
jgi:hypothetical protein